MEEHALSDADRTVYLMPVFVTLTVSNITAAVVFYREVGFELVATIPGPDSLPVLAHLRRAKYQDLLLVPGRTVPGTTTVSFSAENTDLEEIAARLRANPLAASINGPADTRWFTSDLTIEDSDGNRIILTAPCRTDMDQIRQWASDNLHSNLIDTEHDKN